MFNDLTGKCFGRIKVVHRVENDKHAKAQWLCMCSCGNSVVVTGSRLVSGKTQSCGCLQRELTSERNARTMKNYGLTREKLYHVWRTMRQRVSNPNSQRYRLYGLRGICVCDEWNEYSAFREWAVSSGYKEGLSIDRIDVNGNYCPENCRWTTQKVQCNNKRNNRRISFRGDERTLSEWADILGMKQNTLNARACRGWNEESILQPLRKSCV